MMADGKPERWPGQAPCLGGRDMRLLSRGRTVCRVTPQAGFSFRAVHATHTPPPVPPVPPRGTPR